MARSTRQRGTDIALIACFAALVIICAIAPALRIPGPVPITLQTFGVLLTGAVLGPRRGLLAVLLYLVIGAVGLPVFSGGAGGLGVFAGPTGGYLIGFPLAAALCGFGVYRLRSSRPVVSALLIFVSGLVGSAVFIHTCGMLGLMLRADLTLSQAFVTDVVFWPGDIIKNVLMAIVATAIHRAFPDLRGTASRATQAATRA